MLFRSSATSYYVAYMSRIGFMWPSTLGFAATVAAGLLLSAMGGSRPGEAALRLTWRSVMATGVRPEPQA